MVGREGYKSVYHDGERGGGWKTGTEDRGEVQKAFPVDLGSEVKYAYFKLHFPFFNLLAGSAEPCDRFPEQQTHFLGSRETY